MPDEFLTCFNNLPLLQLPNLVSGKIKCTIIFLSSMLLPPSLFQSDGKKSEDVAVSDQCRFLPWLNCMLLLLNFSGWRDARRENSRKTSTQESPPVTGDTEVKWWFDPKPGTLETAVNDLLFIGCL